MPSADSPSSGLIQLRVESADEGKRLDVFLAQKFSRFSRVQLRRSINAAEVRVNGRRAKASHHVKCDEWIELRLPTPPREGPEPENIPLEILLEDSHLIAVNKPSGMVVHPAKGHWSGTLAGALAFHFGQLSQAGGPTRPGIVHRLDRETSGVMVVAKTDEAHLRIASQFEARTVVKEYFAVLQGAPDRDRDVIQRPIGVHPYHREKMAIRAGHTTSRDAVSQYEVIDRLGRFATVRVKPQTGRTHQIRVHMQHIGCPVLCDRLYGGRSSVTGRDLGLGNLHDEVLLDRLALHAHRLKLNHPKTGQSVELAAPIPSDIAQVVVALSGSVPE